MGRSYKTGAVVLRSMRFSESDRILHLFTSERGRVNAIAKGVRKTGSRFGGRLEPLTHVALVMHEGRGELHTIAGADIVRSHAPLRERPRSLAIGLIGAEAVLKLFAEPEPQPRVFEGLARFLELLDAGDGGTGDPAHDMLGLGFQVKLLLLAGYLPHLTSCANCGASDPLVGFSPAAGGAVCGTCRSEPGAFAVDPASIAALEGLIERPLAPGELPPAAARDALRVVEASYAYHGGFRLRTLAGHVQR